MMRCLIAAVLVLLSCVSASAQDQWALLKSVTVSPSAGFATIDTRDAKGRFKSLKLISRRGTAVITKVAITYNDGRGYVEERRIVLGPGERTRAFDERTQDYFVNSIMLELEKSDRGPVAIEIWGLQDQKSAGAARPPKLSLDEQKKLIEEALAAAHLPLASVRIALDRDGEVVARSGHIAGKFVHLRVLVQDKPVEMVALQVVHENGAREQLPVGALIKPGETSEWLRLEATPIKEIRVAYKAAPDRQGEARIEVQGQVRIGTPMAWAPHSSKPNVSIFRPEVSPTFSDCVQQRECTPIQLFYGTNRQRSDKEGRIGFGPDRADGITYGSAVVTVPKSHGTGAIDRPSWWNWRDWFRLHPGGEDPKRHFVILKDGMRIIEGPDQFIAALKAGADEAGKFKDHAFVYVHGFNVDFDFALYRLAQLTFDLGADDEKGNRIPFGVPIAYSWPAKAGINSAAEYAADKATAEASERHLREFIELVTARSGIKNIHVIAHSMGNQPLLRTLKHLSLSPPAGVRLNQIILAAPDVDREAFEDLARNLSPVAANVTLYASSKDKAMMLSNRLHKAVRAGDVPKQGPVLTDGVDSIDVSAVSTDVFAINHNAYADDTRLINDIALLFRAGRDQEHPPEVRTPVLRKVPRPPRSYWRYPG